MYTVRFHNNRWLYFVEMLRSHLVLKFKFSFLKMNGGQAPRLVFITITT